MLAEGCHFRLYILSACFRPDESQNTLPVSAILSSVNTKIYCNNNDNFGIKWFIFIIDSLKATEWAVIFLVRLIIYCSYIYKNTKNTHYLRYNYNNLLSLLFKNKS